jgi:HEAT repeat protein
VLARAVTLALAALVAGLAESPVTVAVGTDGVAARKLLHDARPAVRLRAAVALAKEQDTEAIPVLIDLLAEVPPAERKAIEQVLQELAGAWAPAQTPAGEDDVARGIRRDAWAGWWRRTNGPALLDEFRKRTLSPAELDRARDLIRKLGDKTFAVREQATTGLVAYGPAAVPLLRQALKAADLERRRRAERCLQAIAMQERKPLPAVAARLVALRKPARAVEVLLAFLPWAEENDLVGEVHTALATLAVRDGQVDPALVRALADPLPVRRAVAVELLAGLGDGRHKPAVRKLLTDPEPAVRLCAAVALVYARDRDAVPVLIDLAASLPNGQAWQAEEVLLDLAGAAAPRVDSASPADYRAAWQAWWKEHGATVSLARLQSAPPHKARVSARASASWEDKTPEKAFDGDAGTLWNAGTYAPQWLEADLGASRQLASLVLRISQLPAGETTHEVWVSQYPIGEDRTRAKLAHTFQGNTDDNQQLKHDFAKGLTARYIQVRTTQSPSWVAWVEVEVRVPRSRGAFVQMGSQ